MMLDLVAQWTRVRPSAIVSGSAEPCFRSATTALGGNLDLDLKTPLPLECPGYGAPRALRRPGDGCRENRIRILDHDLADSPNVRDDAAGLIHAAPRAVHVPEPDLHAAEVLSEATKREEQAPLHLLPLVLAGAQTSASNVQMHGATVEA